VSPLTVRLGRPRLSGVRGGAAKLDMSAMRTVLAQDFYGVARTSPVAYWSDQDAELNNLLRVGYVDLGPIQKVQKTGTP